MDIIVEVNDKKRRHDMTQVKVVNKQLNNEIHLDFDFTKLSKFKSKVSTVLEDFLFLSTVIYSIDKSVKRQDSRDNWTRNLTVKLPLSNHEKFNKIKDKLQRAIGFLTGDEWIFKFTNLEEEVFINEELDLQLAELPSKQVSLFSGGLDSLIGVINWLEENPKGKIVLVGHYDRHITKPKTDQDLLFSILESEYKDRIELVQVRVGQLNGGSEDSLRSRSLLFISLGLYVSNSINDQGSLMIPENGVIALNVPLTPSRRGSCSTRTAHPFFLSSIQQILLELDIDNKLENPLMYYTKGEAVEYCLNQNILKQCIPLSVSCGKRGHTVTWNNRHAKGCGKCVPCIYRRAALHKINEDTEIYGVDFCKDMDIESNNESEKDLRAFLSFIRRNYKPDDISKLLNSNGKIPIEELSIHSQMVYRAIEELKSLIKDKGNHKLNEKSGLLQQEFNG